MADRYVNFGESATLIREAIQPRNAANMPYIGLEHIDEGTLRLNGFGLAADVTSTKFRFSEGDILFGKLRPYFRKVIRAPFDGVCSTDIWVVRAKLGFDQGFLYYWMASQEFVDFATQGSEGTKMPRAKWEHVSRFERPALSLNEQRAIALILGSLDDKIELNRRMNETLVAMARAIFKSWFVDFDPVRAKAEGRQPVGMDAETAALFPDSFIDSELGEIPKGWEVMPVGDAVKAVGGGTPSTKIPEYWLNGTIHWATPKDLSDLTSCILTDTSKKITSLGLSKVSSSLLPNGTVLLSSRAPVGYLAIANMPLAINQGFIAMVCDGPLSNYYMLNWAQEFMDEIKQRAGGTTFAEISKRNFRPIPILVPPEPTSKSFEQVVSPYYRKIVNNLNEVRTLEDIRDRLLPMLLSGRIRMSTALNYGGNYEG